MSVGLAGSLLGGCSSLHSIHHHLFGPTTATTPTSGGTVVADEPQAALVGRDILARGGNAADAATATAFALSVTLPSRASLGGGGACLISRPHHQSEAITFIPVDGSGDGGDRPASVPMMARGLFMLQLHYGTVQFGDILDPAITLAQQGITVSKALSNDIAAVKAPLMSNEDALALLGKNANSDLVTEGDQLTQTRLTSFLSRLKLVGVGDLYNGSLANAFLEQANRSGANLTARDLRQAVPLSSQALSIKTDTFQANFLPPPADGGIGSAFALQHGGSAENAVNAWRHLGLNTLQQAHDFIDSGDSSPQGLPPLPASTSFVVHDSNGMAVGCSLTENNLFGTGRIAGTSGVFLGASSHYYPRPLLSVASLTDPQGRVASIVAASGQNDAAQAVTNELQTIVKGQDSSVPSGAGRLNRITCKGASCQGQTDPNGNGLSTETIKH